MELNLADFEKTLRKLEARCDERRDLEERFTSRETSRLARMQGALEKAEREGASADFERIKANFETLEATQAKRIELENLRDLAEEQELAKMRRELAKMKQAQNPQALEAMQASAEKFLSRLEGEINALELRLSSSNR